MNTIKKVLKKYNNIPVAAKATLWFIFCNVLQKCIALITTPIFTRIMNTEQYGQYSVYNSWLQIFTIITTLRLNYAVFNKGMSKYKDDRDGYTSTMQTVTLITTGSVFALYLVFHRCINALIELPTFIMGAIFAELFLTPAIDFWTIRKRYEYLYKPVVFRTLIMAFLNASLGVVAVLLSEEKGYARILTCVLVNVCFGLVLFVYNLRKGKTLLKREYAVFALSFNLPLLLHYISQYVLDQFDRIMIQKMVGMAAAGIYSVAYNCGILIKIITDSVNNALVPWQYEQLEKRNFKELDDTLFKIYVLIAACVLMFTSFAPEVMKILADPQYYEAVYVIPPVAIGMFFCFMYSAFGNIEFFFDCNKFTMYISMAGAALNFVLNYIGIKLFGYMAAAYTTLICYMFFAGSHYIYMSASIKKLLGINRIFKTKRLLLLSVFVTVFGIFIIFFYDKVVIRYAILAAMFVIVYWQRNRLKSILLLLK